jgi:cardiolipin synthase
MQGAAAESFTAMFLQTWHLLSKTREPLRDLIAGRDAITPSDGWVQPYADSPMDKIHTGERIYMHAISRSQKCLYITTPYMTVGEEIIAAPKWCAQSGVDVRIFTPGIPDKKVVFFTTRSYYRDLISSGVKIYEYTPGFVHGKVALCDDVHGVVGSINLDYRSLYHHFECAAYLYRIPALKDIHKDFEHTMDLCRRIYPEHLRSFPLWARVFAYIAKFTAPLV